MRHVESQFNQRFSAQRPDPKIVCCGYNRPHAPPANQPHVAQYVEMFDPLHKWLGIPPNEQPPNHYRLLGITVYENDPDVIDAAADKQLAFLHDLTNGEQAEMAEQLSNQVSAARLCLLDDEKKIAYDDVLRNTLDKQRSAEPNPAVSQTSIEPSYQIPQLTSQPPVPSPTIQTKKRRKSGSSKAAWTYSRLSTLLCIVALALIGIGVWQGRITLNLSLLESLGLMSSTKPAPIPETPAVTSRDTAAETPEPSPGTTTASTANAAANQASSPTTARPADTPPAQSTTPSIPSPQPREGSLADLAHSSSTAKDSAPQVKKSPVPSETELEDKMALVRELYEDNYRNAKTTAEKIELAKLMHRDGQETTDDSAGRFALWQVAHDIFTREGEYALALGIVDNLNAHYFDIDTIRMKAKSLRDSASHVSGTQVNNFLDAVVSVVTACGQQDQFELAKSLAAFTTKEFESRNAKSRLTTLDEISSEIEARELLFNKYQAALETLKTSEDDPDANLEVGEYLCFVRGQWDQGLKRLALSSNAKVRAAAVRELAIQTDAVDAMTVADAWYGIAEDRSGSIGQANLHRHAYQWYKRAEPNSQGLDLKKVEARLAELEELIPNQPDDSALAGNSASSKVLGYRVRTSTESRSDFADRKGNEFTLGMGSRPDGRGEAMAAIELKGVKNLKIVGSASQQMLDVDPYSKTGFVIDYHTPGGYSKRIFLGLGLRPGRKFSDAPLWGAAKSPDLTLDIGRSDAYEIDLTRWAPSTWDGQCWFTIYMQNAGANRTLFSTVSW